MNYIFDFDGTLYEKKGFAIPLIVKNIRELKLLLAERKVRKKLHGIFLGNESDFYHEFFSNAAVIANVSEEQFKVWYFEKFMNDMIDILWKKYRAYPQVNEFFKKCAARGDRLFIYSDYGRTKERMDAIGADYSYIEIIADAPSYGGLKPAKEGFIRFLNENDIAIEESWLIGDSDTCDRALAESVGMKFYSVKDNTWDELERELYNIGEVEKRGKI